MDIHHRLFHRIVFPPASTILLNSVPQRKHIREAKMPTIHQNSRKPIRNSNLNRKRKTRRLRSYFKQDRETTKHSNFLQRRKNHRLKLRQTSKFKQGRCKTHKVYRTGLVILCTESSTKKKENNTLLFYS